MNKKGSLCHNTFKVNKYLYNYQDIKIAHQVINDVELVITCVFRVDFSVLFFPHVFLQHNFVSESLLTVQALQTVNTNNKSWSNLVMLPE